MRPIPFVLALTLLAAPVFADELIPMDAPAGAEIFAQATAHAGALSLLRYYEAQAAPAFCGVASSVITLNSLGIAAPLSPKLFPDHLFDQDNFFTEPVLAIKSHRQVSYSGLELEQLAAMLATYPVTVETFHANQLKTVDEFRRVAGAALGDPSKRVIVNYSRKALDQDGGGHISPLAAYDPETDRFLILDVARYRLPPVWATAKDLWGSINTTDKSARKKRGMLIVTKE